MELVIHIIAAAIAATVPILRRFSPEHDWEPVDFLWIAFVFLLGFFLWFGPNGIKGSFRGVVLDPMAEEFPFSAGGLAIGTALAWGLYRARRSRRRRRWGGVPPPDADSVSPSDDSRQA